MPRQVLYGEKSIGFRLRRVGHFRNVISTLAESLEGQKRSAPAHGVRPSSEVAKVLLKML